PSAPEPAVAAPALSVAPHAPVHAAPTQQSVAPRSPHSIAGVPHPTRVAPQRISGAIDAPHASPWTVQFLDAARGYGVLALLLIAALALRMVMTQSLRVARNA